MTLCIAAGTAIAPANVAVTNAVAAVAAVLPLSLLQGGLRHPMNEMAPDVPKSCVMYIATTDGALRMNYLTNFKQAQGLARAPQPVPAALPPQLTAALAEAGRLAAQDEVGYR